jgi:hypothetical protein
MNQLGEDDRGLYGVATMHSDPEFAAARDQRERFVARREELQHKSNAARRRCAAGA